MSEPSGSWGMAEASANWRLAPGDLPNVNVWVGCAAPPTRLTRLPCAIGNRPAQPEHLCGFVERP